MTHKANYMLGKKARDSRLGQLLDWIDENADAMLSDPDKGLEAIGVGRKNADRLDCTDAEWCLVGFVKKKLSDREMSRNNVPAFAEVVRIATTPHEPPEKYEIDVVEAGGAFTTFPGFNVPVAQRGAFGGPPPSIDLQKPFSLIRTGVGITNPVGSYPESLSVGTLGFFVRDADGVVYLVSNNHVIGRENAAQIGNAVVQPGTLDLTQTELDLMDTLDKLRNQLQIARVSAVVDIDFGNAINEVDVAAARLEDDTDASQITRIGYGAHARGIAQPFDLDAGGNVIGETRVYKAGRTTGWTEGTVSQIGVASNVEYSGGIAAFRNQLGITPTADNDGPFSDRGDSGSGIWNVDNQLVGLLYAGSPSRTLANPIDLVMQAITAELGVGPLDLVTSP